MAILGLGYYLCEACKWFDTDGEDGNHPYCIRQSCVDTPPGIAVRLGDECPFGYEFGVPSGYPVSKEDNERRAYEIKAILENRGRQMKLCPYCHNPLSDVDVNQLQDENAKLRELMSEGVEVGKALLRYRDNPPIKRAGPIEGTWYEMGEILSIIMHKPEFTNGELLTRLAYLMGVRE